MVGAGRSIRLVVPKSAVSRCSQVASFAASDTTFYSASVVDKAVHSCNFDLHDMALLPQVNE